MVLICYTCSFSPIDLPNLLDDTLQTLLVSFGIAEWVYLTFQASVLQILLIFQPFRETKCESQ